jgi:hypothetical protein
MKAPLTKSLFMKGLPCTERLRLTIEQLDNKAEADSFLKVLAEGGFQVEALARMQYPDGIFIDTKHGQYEKAAKLTKEALEQENVVLFEAAFLIDGYFVRTDILEKKGNKIKIIEVKAKSYSSDEKFLTAAGRINKKWEDKLWDLAFQKFVVKKSFQSVSLNGYEVEAAFLFADKTKKASIDGMNQLFRIPANGNPRTGVSSRIERIKDLGTPILIEVNEVDAIVNDIIDGNNHMYSLSNSDLRFRSIDLRNYLQKKEDWGNDSPTYKKCKNCEFRTIIAEDGQQVLSDCFARLFDTYSYRNAIPSLIRKPNIFEIWDYKSGPNGWLERGNLFLEDLTQEDLNVTPEPDKISRTERQWLQIQKTVNEDHSIYVEKEGLKNEMHKWQFPLHFIDFETSGAALPFTKNMRPYEQVAFQFSHHMVLEDGTINHQTEYINNTPGEFPNFSFARALYQALKNDKGTIFRYHNHENTILNVIIRQLQDSQEPDAAELITFIKTITISTGNSTVEWKGERAMVDLHKIIKEYYYNPLTKGSISLKYVLPACLNTSELLKNKYSQSLAKLNISSKNFSLDHVWLQLDGDKVASPYKMLPPLFENWEPLDLEDTISDMEDVADGGAALTAYAKLQYQDMSDKEREEITKGLLKYCELDTLAMVMVYEHLRGDC